MISFKYFNRFLVAGLLLAGQILSVQAALKQQRIKSEVARINNSDASDGILNLSISGITDQVQPKLIEDLSKIQPGTREKIKIVELWRNEMDRIPWQVLALFPNAESIDLSRNRLNLSKDFLPKTSFNKIKIVDIANNELKKIDEEFFNLFPSLQNLSIHGNCDVEIPLEALKRLSQCKQVHLGVTPLIKEIDALVMNSLQPQNFRDEIILDGLKNFTANCFSNNMTIDELKNDHIAIDIYTLVNQFHMPKQAEIEQLKNERNLWQNVIAQQNDTIKGLCAALGNLDDEALQ